MPFVSFSHAGIFNSIHLFFRSKAPLEALRLQAVDLKLRHIKPGGIIGREVEGDAAKESVRFLLTECFSNLCSSIYRVRRSSMRSRKSGVRFGMHHIFFPPRFERCTEEYMPDPFMGNGLHVVVCLDELISQDLKRPVVVSFRRVCAGRGDDECFVLSCNLFWLSGTGRIVERSFKPSLAVSLSYIFWWRRTEILLNTVRRSRSAASRNGSLSSMVLKVL
jgi:hypothetical protein